MIENIIFFLLAFFLTFCLRKYALAKNIIDNPNERSSHTIPTPRGGGVAIVVSYSVALLTVLYFGETDVLEILSLLGAGLAIAFLGFLDDHGHINALVRLLIHFIVSIAVVIVLGGFSEIQIFNGVRLGFIANIIAVLFLVWLLNLYNFMDGINGIASVQAITSTITISCLYLLSEANLNINILILLASCTMGFLLWNFPKAKIFMGDAGSGFLGITLGILALLALKQSTLLFCVWLICLGVFIVDATFTLILRITKGYKIYDAHRSHAYQIASRKYNSHVIITSTVAVINIFWLFPIAYYIVYTQTIYPELFVLIAYMPLILIAIYLKAGVNND